MAQTIMKHWWEYSRWEFSGWEFSMEEFDGWEFSRWKFYEWEFSWYRLYHVFLHFFSLSVLLKLLKHVKLIVFENYNEWKQKTSVFDKKVVARFDKKIARWRKKSIDEEKNLLLRALKKQTLSLRTQSRPHYCGP